MVNLNLIAYIIISSWLLFFFFFFFFVYSQWKCHLTYIFRFIVWFLRKYSSYNHPVDRWLKSLEIYWHYHTSKSADLQFKYNSLLFVVPRPCKAKQGIWKCLDVRPRYVVSALRFLFVDQLISNLHTSIILGISSLKEKAMVLTS